MRRSKAKPTTADINARVEDLRRTYFTLFGTEEGKRVLADLEERCFVHKGTLSLARGGFDPLMTAWCEGRRSVLLDIRDIIKRAKMGEEAEQETTATRTGAEPEPGESAKTGDEEA